MNKYLFLILTFAFACNDAKQEHRGIVYERTGETCDLSTSTHWLIDLEISSADSVILDTRSLQRKVELSKQWLDTSSAVYELVATTCVDHQLSMSLKANDFYSSLGGSLPVGLDSSAILSVNVWVLDALNDDEYLAHKMAYERQAIVKYAERNGWNAQRDSATGVYYEALIDRETSETYSQAKINYTIMTLNHDLIVQNRKGEPLEYSSGDLSILPGVRFVADRMSQGDRFRAILPSGMAYGAEGNKRVPGFTPVVIELEMIETTE